MMTFSSGLSSCGRFASGLSRRRFLTALLLSPCAYALRGQAASVDVHRIVALEWQPLELLMALGVTPLGVADKHNYQRWVKSPTLPDSVVDVGLRTEPNLELLTQLRPSLLLYADGFGPSPSQMARIAPGMGFSFINGDDGPLESARRSLRALGDRLNLRPAAEQHLASFSRFLQQARVNLRAYTHRPLLLFTVMDARHVLILGRNSLFQSVMDELGIENAWQGETNAWGSLIVGMEKLATLSADIDALCFDHGNGALMDEVAANPLWQALPFVRHQRWQRVEPVWFYGGTLSAMRFCETLANAREAFR
ncbi:Fe(3+)-hydroxamate ABC transporter substrate-binding protein FhuD [Lonsdalea britannica]|uniref:Fe(3+)-hydroxamate ABC transporter substrate-binding protein FhuD n=1 Tax=Lonsdalea britannica TaxID=1082704 RepID=UPI0026ED3264|nr:Fe(3+)-hydroxamate ABC transporter substrate-binding protein FhuD [Lonsdalea britannica]